VILDEPRIRFGADIRVPDLGGWRRERWVNPPRQGPIPIIPDWICEVLSRSTETEDRTTKLSLCGAHGVKNVWLLNPIARTLEIFRLESQGWFRAAAYAKDQMVRAEPFDAVELNLALLWPEGVEPEQEG
jgi:Uma2 family endonuclease